MTQRLYSTEKVIDSLVDEEWEDQDEPMMDGSDEEFSDFDDDDDIDHPPSAEPLSPSSSTRAKASAQ